MFFCNWCGWRNCSCRRDDNDPPMGRTSGGEGREFDRGFDRERRDFDMDRRDRDFFDGDRDFERRR